MVSFIVMPQFLPFASSSSSNHVPQQDMPNPQHGPPKRDATRKRSASVLRTFHRIGDWLRKDEDHTALSDKELHQHEQKQALEKHLEPTQETGNGPVQPEPTSAPAKPRGNSLLGRTFSKSKKVVPELSRQFTSKRLNSERRERLLAVEQSATERRAVSADRQPRKMSPRHCPSTLPAASPSRSAPDVSTPGHMRSATADSHTRNYFDANIPEFEHGQHNRLSKVPSLQNIPPMQEEAVEPIVLDDRDLQAELEAKWILNLSMHFRDKSDREKFFVTYAQEPNLWRRVTVSCDYRNAPPSSLESDLKSLKYQRDKSQRIYEAIRESLSDIQFYDTVTNLKLETEEGQLHVHVTEDINEIIPYPLAEHVGHVDCRRYCESELDFQSHLSGFVYKVSVDNRIFIKKEIPGPDTVDEFLYEVEALNSLRGSKSVIDFHGLVVDEKGKLVKGLLISFGSLGALVDMIYDYKLTDSLPWHRRERWAYQIVQGLSEIHEGGFTQGDFTLSNIVIDSDDNAKVIDINRRGCPIGWEPPELLQLVRSGRSVSMFIGPKSDIFQLGMVLWALAEQHDEPEHVERSEHGMPHIAAADVPRWFTDIVIMCLSQRPRDRPNAKEALSMFPLQPREYENRRISLEISDHSFASHHSHKEFIDPATTVDRNDIEEFKRRQRKPASYLPSHPTTDPYQFVDPATSTGYRLDSTGSYIMPHRGRSPYGYRPRSAESSTTSLSFSQGPLRCEYICDEDMPKNEHASSSQDHHSDLDQQRPLVPDASPYHPDGLDNLHGVVLGEDQGATRRTSETEESSPHPVRRQRVLFGPPVHQDSGFDEYMAEAIEHGQPLSRPLQRSAPPHGLPHGLPRILTTAVGAHYVEDQDDSAVTQQSGSLMSAAGPHDASTPHSPPTPLTPFSYHTPLASPLGQLEQQRRY